MGKYCVIRCPHCHKAKNVLSHVKTTKCNHCENRIDTSKQKCFFTTDDVEMSSEAVGRLNSEYHGKKEFFIEDVLESELDTMQRKEFSSFDSVHDYVGYRVSSVRGAKDKIEIAMRLLTEHMNVFTADDLCRVFEAAGEDTSRIEDHIEKMKRANLIFSRDGVTYEYIG